MVDNSVTLAGLVEVLVLGEEMPVNLVFCQVATVSKEDLKIKQYCGKK